MLHPKLTFGEVFGYVTSIIWNLMLVVVALASFAKSETAFQRLTFVFLLIIYIRVALLSDGLDLVLEAAAALVPHEIMRFRILLRDEVSPEEHAQQAKQRDETSVGLRKRTVRIVIRVVFSGLLFVIACWNLIESFV